MAEPAGSADARAAGRIPVPGLRSRSASMWLSVLVAAVAVLGIVGWALATQPVTNQVAAVVLAVVLFGGLGALAARRSWMDTDRGTLVRRSWTLRQQEVAWSEASRLRLQPNHAGQLMLEVRGASRRASFHLPLVAVDLGGDRSQPPEVLRALADQIESWAPERASVARKLRAQADHLAGGGAVRESPLATAHLVRGR